MDDSTFFLALAEKLHRIKTDKLATQSEIARVTSIDQETVSKVLNGKRTRRTAAMDRLDNYANMLISEFEVSFEVTRAVAEFLAFGTEHELLASIRLCTSLVSRRSSLPSKQQ